MTPPNNQWLPVVLGVLMILTGSCTPVIRQSPSSQTAKADALPLTKNEQIAGEIMAYLIEVVLGQAGPPKNRPAWSSRGLDLPLDLDLVKKRMFGPVPLRAELMVLDTNILGLSQVLYHYDRRLNLFKGTREHDSLYPCSELMAIRLLLLRKLHTGETVRMAAIEQHADRFAPQSRDAIGAELAAMGLSAEEFRFLKAIFRSEPAFLRYMQHPFIVSTLKRIGVAEPDAVTLAAEQKATYVHLSSTLSPTARDSAITVAIVPAMLPSSYGSDVPSADYHKHVAQVQHAIQNEMHRRVPAVLAGDRLSFFVPRRPVTIHPKNAERVIGQLCPEADFTLILLGKNVYRSLFIDPAADIYPHKRWIYLDVDDVRYRLFDDAIDTVVSAIFPARKAARLSAPAM